MVLETLLRGHRAERTLIRGHRAERTLLRGHRAESTLGRKTLRMGHKEERAL